MRRALPAATQKEQRIFAGHLWTWDISVPLSGPRKRSKRLPSNSQPERGQMVEWCVRPDLHGQSGTRTRGEASPGSRDSTGRVPYHPPKKSTSEGILQAARGRASLRGIVATHVLFPGEWRSAPGPVGRGPLGRDALGSPRCSSCQPPCWDTARAATGQVFRALNAAANPSGPPRFETIERQWQARVRFTLAIVHCIGIPLSQNCVSRDGYCSAQLLTPDGTRGIVM